ncbi:MAG TPA: serine hydrolase domain-containing protein [Kofleriaceae bacterium]|jgi:CubicO group peptidase (beta-lactamase class C family)
MIAAACGAPPPPTLPVSPPTPATTTPPPPAPPAPAAQRFANVDLGYRFDDPDRKAKLTAAAQQLDAAIADEMTREHVPGLALGIVVDGELVFAKGYGVADVDAKTPPDLDTAYRLGSLTKSFTAVSVLALRDDGVLTLDDPLVRWVPAAAGIVYPTRDAAPITLRQLLTHTSGLPREYDRAKTTTEAEVLAQLDGLALESPPGQTFSYSNLGYVMLGMVVAHASHLTFRDFVTKRIFEPLGMTASAFDSTPKLAPAYEENNRTRDKLSEYRLAVGAGGIVSTVRDLARYVAFELAAYPPRSDAETGPIRRASVRESHATGFANGARVTRRDGKLALDATSYGFGWSAHRTCDGNDLVEHNGGIDSYRTAIALLVDHGVGVIVMTNFGNANTDRLTERVIAELRASGALKPYVAHPPLAPEFDAAMKRFLVAYNAPSDAALRDMLAREPGPRELDELTSYNKLHGTCSSFTLAHAKTPTDASFALTCERGRFEVQARLGHDKLAGFSGISRGVDVPPAVKKLAVDALSLIDKWSDGVFARTFADPKGAPVIKDGSARLHAALGSCRIAELMQETQGWGIDATCDRGTAHFYFEEKASKLTSFLITHADGVSSCTAD